MTALVIQSKALCRDNRGLLDRTRWLVAVNRRRLNPWSAIEGGAGDEARLWDSSPAPVPVHIERSSGAEIIPETTDYQVSLGGSKDTVGTVLLGTMKGMRRLQGFLVKLGVAPTDLEIACRVLTEQAHHEILDVQLRPAALRDLGNP